MSSRLATSILNSLLCLCLSSAAVWRPSFLIMIWFCWVGSASEELLLKRRYINWRLRFRVPVTIFVQNKLCSKQTNILCHQMQAKVIADYFKLLPAKPLIAMESQKNRHHSHTFIKWGKLIWLMWGESRTVVDNTLVKMIQVRYP